MFVFCSYLSASPQVQLCQVQYVREKRNCLCHPVWQWQLVGLPQPGHVHGKQQQQQSQRVEGVGGEAVACIALDVSPCL